MNKGFIVLPLSIAVGTVALFAQAPTGPSGGGSINPGTSTSSAATTLSVHGTIDTYDRSTGKLVLSTPRGTVQFMVAPTTRVRRESHAVDLVELPKLAGERATVRYTESGGKQIVESVHVFEK